MNKFDLNKIIETTLSREEYELLMRYTTPDKMRFPNGLKCKYYDTGKHKRFRRWVCCWSITRNANGKFISWIYAWRANGKFTSWGDGLRGIKAEIGLLREHVRKKDAKARAHKIYRYRMEVLNSKNKLGGDGGVFTQN